MATEPTPYRLCPKCILSVCRYWHCLCWLPSHCALIVLLALFMRVCVCVECVYVRFNLGFSGGCCVVSGECELIFQVNVFLVLCVLYFIFPCCSFTIVSYRIVANCSIALFSVWKLYIPLCMKVQFWSVLKPSAYISQEALSTIPRAVQDDLFLNVKPTLMYQSHSVELAVL